MVVVVGQGRGIFSLARRARFTSDNNIVAPRRCQHLHPGWGSFEDMAINARLKSTAPLDYTTPSFPSLYWPYKAAPGVANYLYNTHDIWRFTLLWTLIVYAGCHVVVVLYAVLMQLGKGKKAWKYVWTFPIIYCAIAGLEALIAGSIVGLILGGIYNAGYFRMSTWFPFIWGLTNVLVLITSSFSIQGGL